MIRQLYKKPILIGCVLGILVFLIIYYRDYRIFNLDIDRLFYRQYSIIAGRYNKAYGHYLDTSYGIFNQFKDLKFVPYEPPFKVLILARNTTGFTLSEATMPSISYPYKSQPINIHDYFSKLKYTRPATGTNPQIIYRYAYLRVMLESIGGMGYIKQSSFKSIIRFPTLKSTFFNIIELTAKQAFVHNLSNYNLVSWMSFNYLDNTECRIDYNLKYFLIGRNNVNVLLFSFGFIMIGAISGMLLRFITIK